VRAARDARAVGGCIDGGKEHVGSFPLNATTLHALWTTASASFYTLGAGRKTLWRPRFLRSFAGMFPTLLSGTINRMTKEAVARSLEREDKRAADRRRREREPRGWFARVRRA
jgi:hypothetical protein